MNTIHKQIRTRDLFLTTTKRSSLRFDHIYPNILQNIKIARLWRCVLESKHIDVVSCIIYYLLMSLMWKRGFASLRQNLKSIHLYTCKYLVFSYHFQLLRKQGILSVSVKKECNTLEIKFTSTVNLMSIKKVFGYISYTLIDRVIFGFLF